VVLISFSAMLGSLMAGLFIVAVGAIVTTVQRIIHVKRAARANG
jgi:hypothetical protein